MGLDKIWVFGEANGDDVASITLEMLAAARDLADTVEVFMAGDGDDYAEELGEHGADTVYSTGDLDGGLQGVAVASAVAAAIADADLLVHLCPVEPFGLAILEAMAAAVPVLVPNSGGAVSYTHLRAHET